MESKTYDVIIYNRLNFRVTRISGKNLPRHGQSWSADSRAEIAECHINTMDQGVAIVEHQSYQVGEIYQE